MATLTGSAFNLQCVNACRRQYPQIAHLLKSVRDCIAFCPTYYKSLISGKPPELLNDVYKVDPMSCSLGRAVHGEMCKVHKTSKSERSD